MTQSSRSKGRSVAFDGVCKAYGRDRAVDGVDLAVEPGEFVSLVGPSGSGKTTLLMMLAGFEAPDSGSIAVGGQDLARLAPNRRNLGVVFQKYALFPHRTVAENIAFPLRMRGVGRAEREARVRDALEQVRLDGYEQRLPAQLSGGQQQRVALARAIVFDPPVILMDEPLGALDRKLRQHMQIEIKALQRRLGATVIYVTHDQDEALTMSDRVAVLDGGRLVQVGAPRAVYDRPETAFAADFLGEMNFLPATLQGLSPRGRLARIGSTLVDAGPSRAGFAEGAAVKLGIRPERVRVRRASDPASGLAGSVSQAVFTGARTGLLVDLDGGPTVRAELGADDPLAELGPGARVSVDWSPDHIHVFGGGT